MKRWWILSNFFFFSSRRRHTRLQGDWSSDVCSSDLAIQIYQKWKLLLYRETGGGFFYSDGTSIYNWHNSSQNSDFLVDYNAKVIRLHHVRPSKLIVSSEYSVSLYMFDNDSLNLVSHLVCDNQSLDQLTYSNCPRTISAKLGPIALDYSKPDVLYYADGTTIGQVNMFNASRANSLTNITLDESLGDVTAMAVRDGLFTIQKSNFTHTVSSYDLVSSKPPRTASFSIESHDTILQAVHLGNGALLCHNTGRKFTLLNTFTSGTTYLPCGSSKLYFCCDNYYEFLSIFYYYSLIHT